MKIQSSRRTQSCSKTASNFTHEELEIRRPALETEEAEPPTTGMLLPALVPAPVGALTGTTGDGDPAAVGAGGVGPPVGTKTGS